MLINNRYRIIRELGAGGFGDIFLAEDTRMPSERPCVVKQLKPVTANPQIFQLINERFAREAAILEALGEGNRQIPRLYAYFEEQTNFYLVQEWIEGETLTNRVANQGKMSENLVYKILLSLLPVLKFVHSHGIVHQDINPDNIMLRQIDGIPILIDFGAVKETMGTVINSSGKKTSSIVIGTPGFMPAEQAAGRPLYSSDLYSLALTAIYLFTEKWPQELPSDPQTGEVIWRQYAPRISPTLATVLDKAIRYHPRDRFHSAQEMLAAIANPVSNASTLTNLPLSDNPQEAQSPRGSNSQTPLVSSQDSSKTILMSSAIAGGLIGASILLGFALNKSTPPRSLLTTLEEQTTSPSAYQPPVSVPESSRPYCVAVDSRKGWQKFNLPRSFSQVVSTSGGWSVDTRNYSPVGSFGHSGRDAEDLSPYSQYKYDQRFPFGALLMGNGEHFFWLPGSGSFTDSFNTVEMRINDADNSLGDNGGSLQVCFGNQ
ncbi:serine/threonine protein kinase [Laspinema sp. A4]|uniref:serine/threonine-protein kinase n=1 Tax=Laspinema sp. D2d TaxID=2953686 RepID=UPI0021BA74EB|nr:serine/threonine-protein kinase [Laspinema sp. D2d]MCT7983507.1 serine/threonine protein kinase [Laspinema sp. D2d]